MTIVIDSTTYNVPIKSINRKAEALDRYAERTEDGVLHRELIGVYYNYDVVMGMSANNVTDYAALFTKLTEAVASHSVTLLGNTFTAYVAGVKDEAVKDNGVTRYYRNLSFSLIAVSPTVTP
jgi:hypothetical protein